MHSNDWQTQITQIVADELSGIEGWEEIVDRICLRFGESVEDAQNG
jgi:hypothetical protein